MIWVIWRQHRAALGGLILFLGALALYVWTAGVALRHAYVAATTCGPTSPTCGALITNFNFINHFLVGGYSLQPVPALVGAFIGAPLLARELETGTFRFAWTQGLGRWRWTAAKLAALALVVTAAAGAISVLFSWYYQPYLATGHQSIPLTRYSVFAPAIFDLRGVAFAAWTLAAFAIGGLAGMLIRRVVPAIAATLAAYTGLSLVAANVLDQPFLAPLLTTSPNVPGTALIVGQWWTKGGSFAFSGTPSTSLVQQLCSNLTFGPLGKPSQGTVLQCLVQHGYTQWTRYQPASRFWAFQWIEGGWLLALSVVLLGVTVWLARRHAT
jgi:ABC-type transport system involved in multi-copper enzyme maturation permease subunit